jgi:hypothetical protein
VLLLALAACTGEVTLTPTSTHGTGGVGGTSTTSATGGAGGAVDPLAITGTFFNTYATDTGDVVLPQDPTTVTLSAMVQRSDGGWDTYPGTLDASGHFVIPDVPLGTATLVVRKTGAGSAVEATVTAERVVALGTARLGRPDVVTASPGSLVTLDVSGAEGWDLASSMFELYSGGSANAALTSCSAGLADCFHPLWGHFLHLVDAGEGDQIWFLHYTWGSWGESLVDAFRSSTFSQIDGVATTLAGTAAPVAQRHVSLTYDAAAFAALAGDFPFAAPQSLLCGRVDGDAPRDEPALAFGRRCAQGAGGGTFDVTYGSPLPPGAALRASISGDFQIGVGQPGGSIYAVVTVSGPLDVFSHGVQRPLLGLPRDLRVNGVSVYAGVSGAGPSPTLSWSAPAVGTPDDYVIDVIGQHLRIRTRDTQVVLPPGLLDDTWHDFVLYAYQDDAQTGLRGEALVYAGSFVP